MEGEARYVAKYGRVSLSCLWVDAGGRWIVYCLWHLLFDEIMAGWLGGLDYRRCTSASERSNKAKRKFWEIWQPDRGPKAFIAMRYVLTVIL